jgi:hypothetical protein
VYRLNGTYGTHYERDLELSALDVVRSTLARCWNTFLATVGGGLTTTAGTPR